VEVSTNRPLQSETEVKRLEELWEGGFGDAYVDRNRAAGEHRASFWKAVLSEFPVQRVLEVGCNTGANLQWVKDSVSPQQVYGVDINLKALTELKQSLSGVNAVWSPARDLPFRDCWFDLTFTMGVLIHQPPDILPLIMSEVVRCSRKFVLCGEYYSEELTEVDYRGEPGALFKRDFGELYKRLFPNLVLRKQGFLSRAEGWDDVTYWVFEKTWQ
jgi:pseudaminic acid biosynthesis-associated methylase